jgi:hypothetical protein
LPLLIQLLQDFLPTPPVSAAEVGTAIKLLKLSKRVGVDRIPSFIIKGISHSFIPLLSYIFKLVLNSDILPSLWKEIQLLKSNNDVVSNCKKLPL